MKIGCWFWERLQASILGGSYQQMTLCYSFWKLMNKRYLYSLTKCFNILALKRLELFYGYLVPQFKLAKQCWLWEPNIQKLFSWWRSCCNSKNSCSHETAKLVKLGSVMSMIVVLPSCWEWWTLWLEDLRSIWGALYDIQWCLNSTMIAFSNLLELWLLLTLSQKTKIKLLWLLSSHQAVWWMVWLLPS